MSTRPGQLQVTFQRFGALAGFPKGPLLARLDWPGVLPLLEGSLMAEQNLAPMLRDTFAVTRLEAGQKDNVIPARATATLDVRLLPDTRLEDHLARLDEALRGLPVRVEVEEAPPQEGQTSPLDDPLYRALEDAVRAHEPEAAVAPWLMVGANDSRFFAPHGVKTYGFLPVFVDKAQLDGIHGHDEHLAVDELDRGFLIYVEALSRFLLRP